MADTDDGAREAAEEGEPLLVRPYILGGPSVPAPRPSAETWPEAAVEPAPHEPGAPSPDSPPPAAPTAPRRRVPVAGLVAAVTVVIAAVAVFGLVSAFRPRSGGTPQAIIDGSLPPYATSAAATASPTGAPARTDAAPALPAPRTSATSNPSPSRSSSAAVSPSATRAATSAPAGLAPTRRAPTPESTISPVPGSARTGTITGAGGLCLDLNGGVVFDDNHIQVYECNRTSAQVWTLATDGTLRVMGMCAQVVRDGTVHITRCDGRDSAQWRAAAGQALVNRATGDCLTDPANGTRSGAGVRVSDCAGTGNQRWRLP